MVIGIHGSIGPSVPTSEAMRVDPKQGGGTITPSGIDTSHVEGQKPKDGGTDLTEVPGGSASFPDASGTAQRVSRALPFDTLAVMFQAAQQQREIATKDREAALESNVANLLASADKLKEAASDRKAAAISTAVSSIVGSVVSGFASALSMRVMSGGKTDAADTYNSVIAKGVVGVGESLSGLTQGIGKWVAAGQEFKADVATANSKKDEAMASMEEKRYQEANDFREAARQAQSAVMDYVRAVAQSDVETAKAVARNL